MLITAHLILDVIPRKSKPKIEIVESEALIDFGTSYKVACKVNGYPKPSIWWENDLEETMPSQVNIFLTQYTSTYFAFLVFVDCYSLPLCVLVYISTIDELIGNF